MRGVQSLMQIARNPRTSVGALPQRAQAAAGCEGAESRGRAASTTMTGRTNAAVPSRTCPAARTLRSAPARAMPKVRKQRSVTATGPIADKSKGQHFLKNPLVVKGIVDRAAVTTTDTVSRPTRPAHPRQWRLGSRARKGPPAPSSDQGRRALAVQLRMQQTRPPAPPPREPRRCWRSAPEPET